jgi:hypothetical protein
LNWKERIISTIKGEKTDFLPFVPRMDLWYKSNKTRRTLPKKYTNSTLKEITEDLDIGFHAIIPDYSDFKTEFNEVGYGLGIHNVRTLPYKVDLRNIEYKIKREQYLTLIEYSTPFGNIATKTIFDEKMKYSGISSPFISEKAFKSKKDYKALAFIFENVKVEEDYEDYMKFEEYVGNRGVAAGYCSGSAAPIHLIMQYLMSYELFTFELHDNEPDIKKLAESISIYYDRVFEIVLKSPAGLIFSGANYDINLTPPGFFKKYLTPFLLSQSKKTHSADKFLITHTDGENKGLLEEFLLCGIDIADSICPYPMTNLTLKDIRSVFNDKITIWGGLPSVCALKDSMSDYNFEKFINDTIESIGSGKKMILSFADTLPPDAEFGRIEKIAKLSKSFRF